MKNFIRYVMMVLAMTTMIRSVLAADVPRYVNFQAVLRDDNGKLLEGDNVNLEFKILDQDGQELYYESQPAVNMVRSSVNVMIGEGVELNSSNPTGGVPFPALSPTTGTKFLQMRIDGNQAGGLMEMGSVPYAVYAQMALKIDPNIVTVDIPDIFVTEDELATYSANIVTTINNSASSTTINESHIDQNIARDSEVAAAIASHNHDAVYVNVAGDTMTGSLNVPDSSTTPHLSGGNFNVGRTLRNHENRITALESAPKPEIFAWAYVSDSDGALEAKSFSGFNIASVIRENHASYGNVYRVTFSSSIFGSYAAVATANRDVDESARLFANIPSRGSSVIRVRVKEESGGQDYGNFSLTIIGGPN